MGTERERERLEYLDLMLSSLMNILSHYFISLSHSSDVHTLVLSFFNATRSRRWESTASAHFDQ